MSKRLVQTLAASLLACLTLAAAGCGGAAKEDASPSTGKPAPAGAAGPTLTVTAEQRARVQVAAVKDTSYHPVLETTGTVQFNGDRSTQVLSPISGPVSRLLVQPGAAVRAGDALATVASPDFADAVANYRKAEAGQRNAKRIADLDEQLFKNDALARSDLDQARTDLAAAQADLEAAVEQMKSLGVGDSAVAKIREGQSAGAAEAVIRAPIPGTVVEKLVSPGQLLEAGATPAFTIADLSTVWVMTNVYQSDLALVHKGEAAEIYTDASPAPVQGRVDYVAALVDPGTKATQVRVVAQNPREMLKRDLFVRVLIHGDQVRTGVLLPASAIMRDDENLPYVYVALPDSGFARRRVTLGGRVADRYEVADGLKAGEHVVLDGALFLQFAESQ